MRESQVPSPSAPSTARSHSSKKGKNSNDDAPVLCWAEKSYKKLGQESRCWSRAQLAELLLVYKCLAFSCKTHILRFLPSHHPEAFPLGSKYVTFTNWPPFTQFNSVKYFTQVSVRRSSLELLARAHVHVQLSKFLVPFLDFSWYPMR